MPPPSETIASDLLSKLTFLRAMSECGHLSPADSVGVPQPTATRWLAALSETVGVPLSTRVGRRVELTRAGTVLAEAVGDVHISLAAGVARALEAGNSSRGHVVFGFLRTLGANRVPGLLSRFRLEYPDIGFTLVQASHEELVDKLRAGTIELALSSPRRTNAGVVSEEIFREPFVLVLSNEHRLAGRKEVPLRACRNETFVGLSAGIAMRERADEILSSAGIRARYSFTTDEVETVRGLAGAGMGMALLPARNGGPLAGSVELPTVPSGHRRIGLISSTQRSLEPAAELFHAWAVHGA